MRPAVVLACGAIVALTAWTTSAEDLAESAAFRGKPTMRVHGQTCTVFTHRELRQLIAAGHHFRAQSPLVGKCVVTLGILETEYFSAEENYVALISDKPNHDIMAAAILLSPSASKAAERAMSATNCLNYRNRAVMTIGIEGYVLEGAYAAWQAMTQNPCVFAVQGRVTSGRHLAGADETYALEEVHVGFVAQATLYEMDSEDIGQIINTAATVLK